MVETFILQWHITEACNLKCKHCYQEQHVPMQLSYSALEHILFEYKTLLKKLGKKGHINITGGEPLCNPHFFKLLEEFKKDKDLYSFSILTNGTLINQKIAKKIKEYDPLYVQVSLEGGKKVNDFIRGKNSYKRIIHGMKCLVDENIFTSISFTATHLNYKEFPKVVKLAKKYHVQNVWSDRYIPLSKKEEELVLSGKETIEYFKILAKERRKLNASCFSTHVSMNRALQFLVTNDFAYHCTAGDTLLTVMENGDLVPCRRMPIVIGNVLQESMYDLYKKSALCKDLRKSKIPEECKGCEASELCRGGLKCLTYALTGSYKKKDLACPVLDDVDCIKEKVF